MFHFLTKKAVLKDLIPDNHVDIHSHLLPGIDDGSKSAENTVEMVTALQKLHFGQFITTPHIMKNVWNNTKSGIEATLAATKSNLSEHALNVSIQAAAEYLLDGNFSELLHSQPLLTLKENYVLVEMSYINPPIQLYDILFDLQVAGYRPVLAHPERYIFYHHNFAEFQKLKHAGCFFQLNLLSIVGYYGIDIAMMAKKLLKGGMIDYVGSDVHHHNHIAAFSKKIIFKDVMPLREAFANNEFFRI